MNNFYCALHNKHFKSPRDLQQHLDSPAHQNNTNKPRRKQQSHKQNDSNDEIKDIPKLNFEGEWVPRTGFPHKKSFGYFKCTCKKWWLSAHSFKNYKQGCQSCEHYSFPKYLWLNERSNKKAENANSDGPHDSQRCEACKAGVCMK